jgi:alpha-D-ribose 1-methylphosphonate 5-triphosphate synthase subunit PhnH
MPGIETAFDQVFDSQKTFRTLLDAFSRPGELQSLQKIDYRSLPKGMEGYVFTIFETLLDSTVGFSISSGIHNNTVWSEYIRVNTGGANTAFENSHFALFNGISFSEEFNKLSRGSLEFPEQGATAIITVESLTAESSTNGKSALILSGPGIKSKNSLYITSFDFAYIDAFRHHTQNYPMGIELLFVDKTGAVAAIPRTIEVKVA